MMFLAIGLFTLGAILLLSGEVEGFGAIVLGFAALFPALER